MNRLGKECCGLVGLAAAGGALGGLIYSFDKLVDIRGWCWICMGFEVYGVHYARDLYTMFDMVSATFISSKEWTLDRYVRVHGAAIHFLLHEHVFEFLGSLFRILLSGYFCKRSNWCR